MYYEYYYEDELPLTTGTGVTGTGVADKTVDDATPDYDIKELLSAWKEYIREKAAKDDAERDQTRQTGGRRPSGSRRPSGGRRPSTSGTRRVPKPTPPPVVQVEYDYDYYDCEPRSESYRYIDLDMCDK